MTTRAPLSDDEPLPGWWVLLFMPVLAVATILACVSFGILLLIEEYPQGIRRIWRRWKGRYVTR